MSRNLAVGIVTMTMFSFGAYAASGQGIVNFKGTVIDAPCGIASGSAAQTIDFGQISKAHLEDGGISKIQNLDIQLVNCKVDAKKTVKVAFTGASSNPNQQELGTTGSTNTTIVISDPTGTPVKFDGTDGAVTNLKSGDNTLRYSTWVQKKTGANTINVGDFTAVVNFNLTYP
ncbi:TPA: fimbrial protein [Providencia alcalifaciens]|uniref:fimbrial protein n=1 Tax=Providencia alcalifaciens TaxID=126385 RepID=UPI001CC4A919|nr:fimbrial protein [Providencia alcalifaciens]CAG9435949.1 Pap fimbrial major pilin protein [Providencia alcalifaciens]